MRARMKSLAEHLGVAEPKPGEGAPDPETLAPSLYAAPLEKMTAEEFAEAVLHSIEFRRYIVNSLTLCTLPATVLTRFMDYAKGWGKPPERVELTGKDGGPIEAVTEIRRVVIHVEARPEVETVDAESTKRLTTH